MYLLVSKLHFLEFRLLLSIANPYLQFVTTNHKCGLLLDCGGGLFFGLVDCLSADLARNSKLKTHNSIIVVFVAFEEVQ